MLRVQSIEAERIFYVKIITQPFNREYHKKISKISVVKECDLVNKSNEIWQFFEAQLLPSALSLSKSAFDLEPILKGENPAV